MRLFRGEEHVHRAYGAPGAIFSPAQLWQLAQRWYGDRLRPDWVPHSRERNQADLTAAGLTGPFFALPADAARGGVRLVDWDVATSPSAEPRQVHPAAAPGESVRDDSA